MRSHFISVLTVSGIAASICCALAIGQPVPPAPAPAPAPVVPAFTNKVLKQEPAIGQLPTGASVLVDDDTCPAGQIKKVIGGNVATSQPRIRSCVPRK
jgi:hypothetical protein